MTHDPNPLAQNDLGKALDRGLNSVDKYSNQIVGGAIALAVIVVAGVLWYRSNQEQNNIAWQECLSATNSGAFEEIANRYTGLPVADWAHLSAGRDQLAEAIALSSYNRPESDKILKKALDNLEAVANSAIPEVHEQALFQLGTAYETKGALTEATRTYDQLIALPESRHKRWAEHRKKWLAGEEAKEFYAWYKEQSPVPPKPPERPTPKDGKGDDKLPSLEMDPENPATTDTPKAEGEKSEDKATPEKPSEKAAEKPAEEKPAASATEKPPEKENTKKENTEKTPADAPKPKTP